MEGRRERIDIHYISFNQIGVKGNEQPNLA